MKKLDTIIVLTLTTTLLLFGLFIYVKTATATKLVEQKKSSSVLLGSIVRLVRDGSTYCSGVVIDKNTILTAAHCAMINTSFGSFLNEEPIEIRGANNRPLKVAGKVKAAFMQLDRAIIKGDFSQFAASKYISDVAASVKTRVPGNKLILCGYPLGGDLFCTSATYLRDETFFLVVKGVLIPGMSGGPTMLEDGTVIATNTAVQADFSIVSPIYNVDMFK